MRDWSLTFGTVLTLSSSFDSIWFGEDGLIVIDADDAGDS